MMCGQALVGMSVAVAGRRMRVVVLYDTLFGDCVSSGEGKRYEETKTTGDHQDDPHYVEVCPRSAGVNCEGENRTYRYQKYAYADTHGLHLLSLFVLTVTLRFRELNRLYNVVARSVGSVRRSRRRCKACLITDCVTFRNGYPARRSAFLHA